MPDGNNNPDRQPSTASCAWCGADLEVRPHGERTEAGPTDTICPRCEADFQELSNEPKARTQSKAPTSRDSLVLTPWMIRRRRGWITAWLTALAGLLTAA